MAKTKARILIVDDEPIKSSVMEDQLRDSGYAVDTATNPLEAEPLLAKKTYDVILTDLRMPGQDGLSFLRELRGERPQQTVIVMTAYGTVDTAVEAMKLGAFDYLQKPFPTQELLLKISRALQYEKLASENEALRRELANPNAGNKIVGSSEPMRLVLERIHAIAGLDTTVLIEGESGTGKELVARSIHAASHRAAGPFVAVSCAVLPRELAEAELFGYEPGAFTGATKRRLGRFELAHGGTLFLDDVDDIPPQIQVKLLRVLQERTFERVGGGQPIRTNVRVVAATKKSISALVSAGEFREDLYYRLHVVPLELPALRRRKEDIPLLVRHFLERLAIKMNRGVLTVAPGVVERLQTYHWPGNVRELEHVMERMVALCPRDELGVADVPELVGSTHTQDGEMVSLNLEGVEQLDLAATLAEVEGKILRWALDRVDGNLAKGAEILGVPRSTFQYRVGKLESPPKSK